MLGRVMAFIFKLQSLILSVADIITTDREYVIPVNIGIETDTGAKLTLFVIMTPMMGYSDGAFELIFNIVKSATQEDSETIYWDGLLTRNFLQDTEQRSSIMSVLGSAVSALIDGIAPEVVSFVTHEPDLPEKALKKYWSLVSVFEAKAYRLEIQDEYLGQRMWKMVRLAPNRVGEDYDAG
jgi:hypothetical protein